MTSTRPVIGIYDSGVGGLSVLEAVRRLIPWADYSYLTDNLNFPYGTRAAAEVADISLRAGMAFSRSACLDVLVVACNTASTVALPGLRASLTHPVVGVVPAVKPAAAASATRTIGLLATPATVARPYTDSLIQEFAAGCRVLRQGSTWLVEAAEEWLRGAVPDQARLRAELQPLFDQSPAQPETRLDTVVLGCTHFPLIRSFLQEAAPWPVRWVDSGEAIANRVSTILQEQGFVRPAAPDPGHPGPAWMTSLASAHDRGLSRTFRQLGFPEVRLLDADGFST